MVLFKNKATNFNADIANNKNVKSFKYKSKLLGNTVAQVTSNKTNGILKNVTITAPLKCLSNFGRSLKIPLINCKIELKSKKTKYCVLFANGNDNVNDNANSTSFTIKDTELYVPIVTLTSKTIINLLIKNYWNEYKTKSENKNMKNEYRYFLESNFVGVNRLFQFIQIKIMIWKNNNNKDNDS